MTHSRTAVVLTALVVASTSVYGATSLRSHVNFPADVPQDDAFYYVLKEAESMGLVTGYEENGEFRPAESISREHFAEMYARAMTKRLEAMSGGADHVTLQAAAPFLAAMFEGGVDMQRFSGIAPHIAEGNPDAPITRQDALGYIMSLTVTAGNQDAVHAAPEEVPMEEWLPPVEPMPEPVMEQPTDEGQPQPEPVMEQ